MSEAKEPGSDEHPSGQKYVEGMFAGVISPDDFAALLGVPKASINLIESTNERCHTKDCPFNMIVGNGNRCPSRTNAEAGGGLHQRHHQSQKGSCCKLNKCLPQA